jgi:hypothetical protein
VELGVPSGVVDLMQQCWQQVPTTRPRFGEVEEKLQAVVMLPV